MYFGLRESARIVDCSVNDLRSLKKSGVVVPAQEGYTFDQLIIVRLLILIKSHANYDSFVFASEINKLANGLESCNFYNLEVFVYFAKVGYSPLYLNIRKIDSLPDDLRESLVESCKPHEFSVDSDDEILNQHDYFDQLMIITDKYKGIKSKPKKGVVILSVPAILRFLNNQVIKEYSLEPEIVNEVKKGILTKQSSESFAQDEEPFLFVGK